MPLEITVGPRQIAIHQGHGVLLTEPDGCICHPTDKGLFFRDTRLISSWTVYANGEPWELLNGGAITSFAARIFLTNSTILTPDGEIRQHTLGLTIGRQIDQGVHEDIDLKNDGMQPAHFNLELVMRSDFADLFEVKASRVVRRGRIITDWCEAEQRLSTVYRNRDFVRAVAVRVDQAGSPCVYANGRLSFDIELAPGATWHACLLYALTDGAETLEAQPGCIADAARSPIGEHLAEWRRHVMRIETSHELFAHMFARSVHDMAALRLPIEGTDHLEFVPAAGLPWFIALFGRDSLITALQTALVNPEFARGALDVLASHQATERDDYRDASPGKIMHELRLGELAHFKLIPHTPYYGSADATPLYLITLHTAWTCTGDRDLLVRHLATAERCLGWIDEYGDLDGDGFQEYATRSSAGAENQSWKDSGNAVVHEDGSDVKAPKALCELQGYVYDAWLRMAAVFDALGKPDRAGALRVKAAALYTRFNDAFWDDELGTYAYALDADKRKVRSVASNAGHCLWSGIVPPERAKRVVERLLAPDMFSGWGIRTLSARHPAFNAYDYQMGAVWPHDNGIIAQGFRRYGFAEEAGRIAQDVVAAGGFFALHQLPELWAGIQRDETNFPVQYLGANVPQAWAAGSVFALSQALLGFQPDAPNRKLYLDPVLPAWLPDLTVRNLRVGTQAFDIRFTRDAAATRFEVLAGDPDAVAWRDYRFWGERLKT